MVYLRVRIEHPAILILSPIDALGVIRSHIGEYGRHIPAGQWGRPCLLTRKIERAKHLQFTPLHAMAHPMSDENEQKPTPEDLPSPQSSGIRLAPGVRVNKQDILISFVRSSGPGGQNVNKRSTKAQLRIALERIPLSERAMRRLRRLGGNAITSSDELLIESDETRSQSRNKAACLDRLRDLVARAVIEPKQRRATKPTKGSIRRRLDTKSKRSETKRLRRPPRDNE